MLSKRCHFQRVLKMLSKCCQNVVKMLSFLCLIFSSFSAHFTLKEKCGKFIIRNVVKMLSFFMDPKRLHLCFIKAPFRLHFALPVPLGSLTSHGHFTHELKCSSSILFYHWRVILFNENFLQKAFSDCIEEQIWNWMPSSSEKE